MIFWLELKKTLIAPAIIGFVVVCLIINAVIIISYNINIDDTQYGTAELNDIFDGFDTGDIADTYVMRNALSGAEEERVRTKYANLQTVVDEKGAKDESLSLYFGGSSSYLHELLFQVVLGAITIEACAIALFAALISTGYENARSTEGIIYASKTGRNILRTKLVSSLATASVFFLLLAALTLALFFARFDWSAVWGENVSSLFNSAVNERWKPFITWRSFTVQELLLESLGMAAGLAFCFTLLGFSVGALIRNSYTSCVAATMACGLMFVVEPIAPMGTIWRSVLNLTPVQLIVNISSWFTDGYGDILWANFEGLGLAASLSALAVLSLAAMYWFKRRNLL